MNKRVMMTVGAAVLAMALLWWLQRTPPVGTEVQTEAVAEAPGGKAAAAPQPERREGATKAPPQLDIAMEIPRDLPALKLPAGASVIVFEEIEDVPTRRHVYGRAATGAIGCIGASGIDLKTLDPEFRARIVIAPTGDGGSQVQDIVMLNADGAPPQLVKCLRKALGETQLQLNGVRGIVTTPPFSGERPAKLPTPPPVPAAP